jgi:hypothetical protein
MMRLFFLILVSLLLLMPSSVIIAEEGIYWTTEVCELPSQVEGYVRDIAARRVYKEDNNPEAPYPDIEVASLLKGDIDENGQEDIFISFAVSGIGGGNFSLYFQALFLGANNSLRLAAERPNGSYGNAVGKTFIPESISRGKIVGTTLEYGPNDGVCCPSIEIESSLFYSAGKLVEMESKDSSSDD